MSHFRLRQRFRRLVDYLSLLSVSSIFLLRAAIPHHAASGWHAAIRPGHNWPRLIHSRKRTRFGHQRYLALTGILLALSLEVCGCDLARDATLPFDSSTGSVTDSVTVRRTLVAAQQFSFYDPTDAAMETPSAALVGGELLPPIRPALREAKPLPLAIPESVFFVYKGKEHGPADPGRQPVATAFVVSVPDRRHRSMVRFLVTARHVVDPEWAGCAEESPSTIDLRLNRRAGGTGYEAIPLQSGQRHRFFTPSDSTADLAIIPLDQALIANLGDYKFLDVPFRLLPTDTETIQFRTEQPVMTARIPAWQSGGPGTFPVFEAGVLAKMPTEAVNVQCGVAEEPHRRVKPLHVWFINAGIPQGASGAPVYTAIARGPGAAKTPVLLGIQSIAWPDQGIVGITPSPVLRDLIQTALRGEKASMDFYKGPGPGAKEPAPSLY